MNKTLLRQTRFSFLMAHLWSVILAWIVALIFASPVLMTEDEIKLFWVRFFGV